MLVKRVYQKKRVYKKRAYYKRRGMRRAKASLHAPKKFCASFKLYDVISDQLGTNPSGWKTQNLQVKWSQYPATAELSHMYKEYAITGVQYQYRPTNVSPDQLINPATNVMFVEDKSTIGNLSPTQAQSQDNVRKLVTSKPFKHYVRKPRPTLFQQDGFGGTILTITPAKQLHWINVQNDGLNHLAAHILIQDTQAATGPVFQGEIWVKMYVIMKEQTL